MLKPTKILVPTDFSEYSDRALQQGFDIAKQYNAELFLFHVIHREYASCVADACLTDNQIADIEDRLMKTAREGLRNQLAKFPRSQEVRVVSDVGKGAPYEAILNEAEGRGIDLIVIASLGRSGMAKFFIGGVARNVLKGAKCPVLLTK